MASTSRALPTVYRGHLFHLAGNPSIAEAADALREEADGEVVVGADGRILRVGARSATPAGFAEATAPYLLPGFVDCHVHFPQVHVTDAWGGGELLEWLERWVFPAEARLQHAAVARDSARDFCDALVSAGTTCALVFGSQFELAQDLLMERIREVGLRAIVGRTIMVEGPAALTTSLDEALHLVRAEIERWHPPPDALDDALLTVAIVPRFALSMNRAALLALGDLWAEMKERGVSLSTHLSENARPLTGEVAQVLSAFGVPRYLDVYDGRFLAGGVVGGKSLLSERTVFAHAVHLDGEEWDRLSLAGCGVAHCPVSQLFLGSGTLPMAEVVRRGIRAGLGSDVGAGDTFSIPEIANAAFKVHMSSPAAFPLHPARLLHLATLGGAQALRLEHRIGNLDPGKEADLVQIDPTRYPPFARRLAALSAESGAADRLFALLMGMGRDTVVRTVVRGRTVWSRPVPVSP
jgi:guanine deaminase